MQYGNSTTKWRFYKLIPLYTNLFSLHIIHTYHKEGEILTVTPYHNQISSEKCWIFPRQTRSATITFHHKV